MAAAALRSLINGLFLQWLDSGMETTAEELAALIEDLYFRRVKVTSSWDW